MPVDRETFLEVVGGTSLRKELSIQLKADKPRREWREGWRRRQERGSKEKMERRNLQKKRRKI